jgi:hypothetical protein
MEANITTGNFGIEVKGEFSNEQREKALGGALRWILQRDVLSDTYKTLGGEKNSKGNLQLPEGFERSSIDYSPESAAKMQAATEAKLSEYGSFTVSVSQHIAGETAAPRAMATAMWAQLSDAQKVALGIAADASEADGIEACHKFLAGFRKSKGK